MAHREMNDPVISIVNYHVDSSDDGMSDVEPAEGQAFVYASSKLPAPELQLVHCPSSSSESDAGVEPQLHQQTAHPQRNTQLLCESHLKTIFHVDLNDTDSDRGRHHDERSLESAKRLCAVPEVARENSEEIAESFGGDEQLETGTVTAGHPSIRKPYTLKIAALPVSLRTFLAETRSFFTKIHSLERLGPCVALTTFAKAEERMVCYLGFAKQRFPGRSLTRATFVEGFLIETYLDFLREGRSLSPATISNHASSLLCPLKYIYCQHAPAFACVPIIAQLRRTATLLQKEGDVDRAQTREELQALNKWLDWDKVLDALSLQRARFEVARSKPHRAREAANLLLLSLYGHIPPSRGLEIRTLEIVSEAELSEDFTAGSFCNRNIALLQRSGAVTVHVQLYKTRRFTGHDQIELQPGTELCRLLRQFVVEFRPQLCGPAMQASNLLFLNANGAPCAFSRHMKGMLMRLTGRAVSVNGLRSAFLTWAYSQPDYTDQMKDSLAAALRHSRQQAQNTYDRRTANEKKTMAVDLARSRAEEGDHPNPDVTQTEDDPRQDRGMQLSPGDFVGLVEEGSTLQQPMVLVGRLQSFLPAGRASLIWYRSLGGGIYCMELDGTKWEELLEALVPVSVKPAKGKPNGYRLTSSLHTLHKAVHGARRN